MKQRHWLNNLPLDTVYSKMASPVKQLTLIASSQGLHAILWDIDLKAENCAQTISNLNIDNNHPVIVKTKQQLTEYFQATRQHFDLPLVLHGTDFQIKAWQQLQKIPYAKTISYAEQATRIGDRKKARAVGMANGLNPIPIIIPCHRVIGSNGHLVGFGGGLDNKTYLLQLEQKF